MSNLVVSSGHVISGLFLQPGDTLLVLSGGLATGLFVNSGAAVQIAAGGIAQADTLAGGHQTISAGGSALDTLILNGGAEHVMEGGTATASFLSASATQYVDGRALDTIVASGGLQFVNEDFTYSGTAIGTMVLDGGTLINDGGTLIDAVVQSGGLVDNAGASIGTILSGGTETISALFGTPASATQIFSGGTLEITDAGRADATGVFAGGLELVDGGGTATSTIINPGGLQQVNDAQGGGFYNYLVGVAIGTTIRAGGIQQVAGLAMQTTVQSAGQLVVSGYTGNPAVPTAMAVDALVMSGGMLQDNGGTSHTVLAGGIQDIGSGGFSDTTDIRFGGSENIAAGGYALSATVASGGSQIVGGAPGSLTGLATDTLVLSGGFLAATLDGTTSGARLAGGTEVVLLATVTSTVISAGGMLFVASGTTLGDTISSGGIEHVQALGTASGTVISSGGLQIISAGFGGDYGQAGRATDTTVRAGGTLYLGGSRLDIFNGTATRTLIDPGGTVDLAYQPATSPQTVRFDAATDMLTISGGGVQSQLQLAGDYTGEYFVTSADGLRGTDLGVVDGTPCYCRGTRILTATGEQPVETLTIGDRLATLAGVLRPLRWIGRRSYAAGLASHNPDIRPVLIRAGALGAGLPHRDLSISPLHALYLDGVLVPAECLIDGLRILQPQTADRIDYFHLELDRHDILLAEGAAAESYLEDGNRGMFHNAPAHPPPAHLTPAYPSHPPRHAAPRIEDGPLLHAIRRRLAAIPFGTPPGPLPELRGAVERVDRGCIAGWAQSGQAGGVRLRITDNGVTLGAILADRPRADIANTAGGDAACGFAYTPPGGLAPDRPHQITITRAADGAVLASAHPGITSPASTRRSAPPAHPSQTAWSAPACHAPDAHCSAPPALQTP